MKTSSNAKSETQPATSQPTRRRPLWVSLLCIAMWVFAPVVFAAAYREAKLSITWKSAAFGAVAVLVAITGVGLWRMRKWGVILLALFGVVTFIVRPVHGDDWLPRFDSFFDVLRIAFGAFGAISIGACLWRIVNRSEKQD